MAERDPVAVVTGASSGIGRAIVLALGERGYRLCLVGRSTERLEQVAEAARTSGAEARTQQVELTDAAAREALVTSVEQDLGGVDVLVHAAGVIELERSGADSGPGRDRERETNFLAPRALTGLFLPQLVRHRGEVVFVNSSAGLNPVPTAAGYSASKQALRRFADELRAKVNPRGVRVLSVYPGRTATPMQAAIFEHEQRDYPADRLLQPEDVAAMVVAALSLPRTAEVTDLMIRPMNKV